MTRYSENARISAVPAPVLRAGRIPPGNHGSGQRDQNAGTKTKGAIATKRIGYCGASTLM